MAHDYPYTYSDLQKYLHELTSDPKRTRLIKSRILCRSLAQNYVHILTISNPHTTLEAKRKKVVVLTSRVHPGETNGSWMMKGFLDFITSRDPDANTLRQNFIFKIIPMLNPDGVVVGNYRCSLGRDLKNGVLAFSTTFKMFGPKNLPASKAAYKNGPASRNIIKIFWPLRSAFKNTGLLGQL